MEKEIRRHSQTGMTLIEMVIALFILSIAIYSGMQFFNLSYQDLNRQHLTATRDRLALVLTQLAGNPGALRNSIALPLSTPENATLLNCVVSSPAGCDTTQPPQPFRLYWPSIDYSTNPPQLGGPITGLPTAPMAYSMDGTACDLYGAQPGACPPNQFPIWVYTTFSATCGPNGSTGTYLLFPMGKYTGTPPPGPPYALAPVNGCANSTAAPSSSYNAPAELIHVHLTITNATGYTGPQIRKYNTTVTTWSQSITTNYMADH